VNPFSSKYDYVQAGKAQFTPEEKAGYELFRSKTAHCNECHRDGGPGEEPLFTDFTASNLGLPPNSAMPFYRENKPDQFGYTPNPLGLAYIDPGVGGFLSSRRNPDGFWTPHASSFAGRYKTPSLRNVDKRPRPDFIKSYMHNGYLKSLKEVVHFYNTRDAMPTCKPGDRGEKLTCWPAPEHPETMNRNGRTGLETATGLSSEAVPEISEALRELLADVFTLYWKTKNFHWHISGRQFRDYHLLLDEQADQIFALTDEIAERARKIGGSTLRSIADISRHQRLKDNDEERVAPEKIFSELRDDNFRLIQFLRPTHEICGRHGDVATTSLLEMWIDQAERRRWFLTETVNEI